MMYTSFIESALREVGEDIKSAFPIRTVQEKSPSEFVTDKDRAVEVYLRDQVKDTYPSHGVVGEEFDDYQPEASKHWVIDPIDGTTNYSHNIPFFCAAMALVDGNTVTHSGVVSPMHDTVWVASRDDGVRMNGEPLGSPDTSVLSQAVLGFCHGSDTASTEWVGDRYASLKGEVGDARQFGAANLELCLVASGDLGGFIGHHIKPWDFLPGCLIAYEAGCTVTGLDGASWEQPNQDSVIAAHPSLHAELLDTVRE